MISPRGWLIASLMIVVGCGGGSGGGNDGGGGDDGGGHIDANGTGIDGAPEVLTISPLDPVIDAVGAPMTQAFTAQFAGDTVDAVWSLDDVQVGTIDTAGLFRAGGMVAGTAVVTARYGEIETSTTVRVRVTLTDLGGFDAAVRDALAAGGTADPSFAWLFPYDKTVFPRGLDAPFLQFAGGAADTLRITATVGDFSYEGYFGPTTRASATLPDDVWRALELSAGAGEDVAIGATKLVNAQVTGPATETWRIAQGDLKGIIYYNSYNSQLAGGGAVLKIRPGTDAEVLQGGCTVCHSVSAQGNVLASGVNWGDGNPLDSASFSLAADGTSSTTFTDTDGRKLAFAALTPDGALMVSNGIPSASPIRGLTGPLASKVYDTATGVEVVTPTFTSQVTYAITPAFSPDGTKLVYTTDTQKTLAVMPVDLTTSPPTFGTAAVATTVASGIAGWASFLPDSGGLVFQAGNKFDTETGSSAELRLVSLADNLVSTLPALNGRDAAGNSILPGGTAEDNNRDYEATILPIPVGGYYWALFTSRRTYGHTLAPGGSVANTDNEFAENNPRKKLWVAAIDLDYAAKITAGIDPSHPSFYLPGQELSAGNMRAYAALEPCRDLGATCESGADCCDGFCRPVDVDEDGNPILACVEPPPGCSNVDEACDTDADCCGVADGATCINNRCATAPVVD